MVSESEGLMRRRECNQPYKRGCGLGEQGKVAPEETTQRANGLTTRTYHPKSPVLKPFGDERYRRIGPT
jgi:hypothetical protein